MREPFTCEHSISELRKRMTKSAVVQVGRQCLNCGGFVGNYLKHSTVANWQALPDWDFAIAGFWEDHERQYLREYRAEQVSAQGVAAFAEDEDDGAAVFQEQYSQYLSSPQWRAKRLLVLDRAGGLCEGCREREASQVHHLTYKRVGREMLFDLVAICGECHDAIHGIGEEEA